MSELDFQQYLPSNKYIKTYLSLVRKRQANPLPLAGNHGHHVLMRSVFPEFDKHPNNIVVLTYREHFIAHKLLWMGTDWPQAQRAMWLMNNVNYDGGLQKKITSKEYSILVEQLKETLSESMSKLTTGMMTALDHFGNRHWIKSDDPRLKTGELYSFCKGAVDTSGDHFWKESPPRITPIPKNSLPVFNKEGKFEFIPKGDMSEEYRHINSGKTNIILKNGSRMKIDVDVYDPNIHKHVNAGKKNAILVSTGKIIQADIDDPRFSTGELEEYRNSFVGSEAHRAMLTERNKISRVWIKKGERSITVLPEDLEEYLSNGWVRGRIDKTSNESKEAMILKLKQRRWINDGKNNLMIYENELSKYVKEGWIHGRIIPKRSTATNLNELLC